MLALWKFDKYQRQLSIIYYFILMQFFCDKAKNLSIDFEALGKKIFSLLTIICLLQCSLCKHFEQNSLSYHEKQTNQKTIFEIRRQ